MRTLVLLLLTACCADDPTEPTLGEAAEAIAQATCSRTIRCGGAVDVYWRECVGELVFNFCATHDCTSSYPQYEWDSVLACAEWYGGLPCDVQTYPCTL